MLRSASVDAAVVSKSQTVAVLNVSHFDIQVELTPPQFHQFAKISNYTKTKLNKTYYSAQALQSMSAATDKSLRQQYTQLYEFITLSPRVEDQSFPYSTSFNEQADVNCNTIIHEIVRDTTIFTEQLPMHSYQASSSYTGSSIVSISDIDV